MDTKIQHSPSPWTVKDESTVYATRLSIGGPFTGIGMFEIADCKGYQGERIANAHLIAAAPEMLAALEMVFSAGDGDCSANDVCNAIDWADIIQVIAKAKGK